MKSTRHTLNFTDAELKIFQKALKYYIEENGAGEEEAKLLEFFKYWI